MSRFIQKWQLKADVDYSLLPYTELTHAILQLKNLFEKIRKSTWLCERWKLTRVLTEYNHKVNPMCRRISLEWIRSSKGIYELNKTPKVNRSMVFLLVAFQSLSG